MKIICLDHEVIALGQGARLKSHSAARVAQPDLTGIVSRNCEVSQDVHLRWRLACFALTDALAGDC
jgi:hypothetical protein